MSKPVVAFACSVALALILVVPLSNALQYVLYGFGVPGRFLSGILGIALPIVAGYFAYKKLTSHKGN